MSRADKLLAKTSSFERLAVYSDRKAFLQSLSQESFTPEEVQQWGNLDEFGNPIQTGVPPVPNPTTTIPETTITGKLPLTKPVFPTIDKRQQEALSKVVSLDGIGIPLQRIDGILGPETKVALKSFKAAYHMENLSDAQALQHAQTLVETLPKYQR
jgi:peptidoglycan hydrolase-like protein with peptidoglycan-binding domain